MRLRVSRDLLVVAVIAVLLAWIGWQLKRTQRTEVRVVADFQPSIVIDELKATYGPRTHSMGPEEWIIRELLQDRHAGVFVDVGAADARVLSNTYYLESVLGWSGLAIDPQTDYAADYATYRPKTVFRPFFVSDTSDTTVPFYRGEQRESASGDPKWAQGPHTRGVQTDLVSTITMDDLLDRERITQFDLLSMDIEGHEPQALAGFTIERFRPTVVAIEALGPTRQAVLDYFATHGYVLRGRYIQADPFNFYFTPIAP